MMGRFYFLVNYVYTYSLYARAMIFPQLFCFYSPFKVCHGTSNPRSALMVWLPNWWSGAVVGW